MAPITAPGQARAQALFAWTVVFILLPIPFVALRLWARKLKSTPFTFNDYCIVAALIATTGFNVNILIASVKGGYGQHITALSLYELDVFQKGTLVSTLLWPTANTLVKISVLHFYRSIFRNHKMDYASYILGALTMAYWLSTITTAFFICRPFEYNWNKITIAGHCGDLLAYYLSTAIVNLLIDVMIVALPLPILWGLQMNLSRKISLMVIFSLGALICIISIVRCVAIAKVNLLDVTYDIVLDNICTCLEPTLGVINACLPLMQPVASKIPGSRMFLWLMSLKTNKTSRRRLSSSEGQQHEYTNEGMSGGLQRISHDLYPLSEVGLTQKSQNSVVTADYFTEQSTHWKKNG